MPQQGLLRLHPNPALRQAADGLRAPSGTCRMSRMSTARSRRDAGFSLFFRKGWVYLAVFPNDRTGTSVYPEDVIGKMRVLNMPRVSQAVIRDVIAQASGEPVRIVEWPEGRDLAATITATVSDDEMEATLLVEPPRKGAEKPDLDDILEELHREGVVFGIDIEAVKRVVKHELYGQRTVIARGLPAVAETGRRIEYKFNTDRGRPYLTMDFGRINLKELNFIENCDEGDLLAVLLPQIDPVDGKTVTGRVVSAERGAPSDRLVGGPNTRLSRDGLRLFARCDGNVRIEAGRIVVEPVVTVKNVDYETGNIRFDGSVTVEGHIADGFLVDATGNVQVAHGVGKATIKAGRHVVLKTGVNGNGEGSITCGGNLFARYVESCRIACGGHAFVEEAIMHSRVSVQGFCILNGRRSEIIGGEVVAGEGAWCKKIGNAYGTPTRIAIGVAPELWFAYHGDVENREKALEELDETDRKLVQLEGAIRDGAQDPRIAPAYEQLTAEKTRLSERLSALKQSVKSLRERIHTTRNATFVIEDTAFAGVTILFGRLEFRVPELGLRKTVLKAGDTGIIESGYDARNKPEFSFVDPLE